MRIQSQRGHVPQKLVQEKQNWVYLGSNNHHTLGIMIMSPHYFLLDL